MSYLGAAEHDPHEPSQDWLHREVVSKTVRHFWVFVAPKLRGRPEVCPRVRLPTHEPVPAPRPELPPRSLKPEVSPHKRVVEFNDFARQMGGLKKSFNFSYLRNKRLWEIKTTRGSRYGGGVSTATGGAGGSCRLRVSSDARWKKIYCIFPKEVPNILVPSVAGKDDGQADGVDKRRTDSQAKVQSMHCEESSDTVFKMITLLNFQTSHLQHGTS
eukprot:3252827-Amphidinium_carterae.7